MGTSDPFLRLVASNVVVATDPPGCRECCDSLRCLRDRPVALAAVSDLVEQLVAQGDAPEAVVTARRKSAPESDWQQTIEARLAEHDRQLLDHEQRISATESQCHEFAYEFDMLSRMALRNARRLDRVDTPTIKRRGPK